MSAEPSMEDILSSIKRIIAEDGDGGSATRQPRRSPRPAAPANPPAVARERVADIADVLELSDPVVDDEQAAPATDTADQPEPILSDIAAEASRGALDTLSRLVVKPAPTAAVPPSPVGETLEGMVREMLRPMLREWLDAKLPGMVEDMVAKEIARITQGR